MIACGRKNEQRSYPKKGIMKSSIQGFDLAELSPLLGQLCAIKIDKKRNSYIGIGKILVQERKPTVYFECAVHLKKSMRMWPWGAKDRHIPTKVCGVVDSYTIHFKVIGADLAPEDWQRIMTDVGDISMSFGEKEIKETDALVDYHATKTKSRP